MAKRFINRINIGRDTEKKLVQAGIDSFEKLAEAGTELAFLKIQETDPGACLSLLYGLEGAIEGLPWHKLSVERKKSLQLFYSEAKRKINT